MFFILGTVAVLRKSDRWNELPSKKKDTKKSEYKSNLLVNVAMVIVFIFILSPDVTKIEGYKDYKVCFNYEKLKIKSPYYRNPKGSGGDYNEFKQQRRKKYKIHI